MSFKRGTYAIPVGLINPATVPFNQPFDAAPDLVLTHITTTIADPIAIATVVSNITASAFDVTLTPLPAVTGYTVEWIAGSQSEVVAALSARTKPAESVNYLTVEEMRMFLLDRSDEDNSLDMDIAFSDGEILSAMRRAAREYNSIPPFVHTVDPNCLPIDTNVFLHATAEQIYWAELARAKRNDMSYTAGGVGANIEKDRIRHFEGMAKMHRGQWFETATKIKIAANLSQAYRTF